MKPGQMYVLHLSKNTAKKPGKIVAIESIEPPFAD